MVQAWLLAVLLAVPPMLLFAFIAPILKILHQPDSIIPLIAEYCHYALWGLLPILLTVVNQQVLAGIKRQVIVTWLSILSLLLSAFFNYSLVLGHFGFAKHGFNGAGIALIISTTITFIISTGCVIKHCLHYTSFKTVVLKGAQWIKFTLKIGLPICLQVSSEMLSFMVLTIMVGWLGEIALAASQIPSEYMLFVIVPVFGLSEASAITVGHAMGEKNLLLVNQLCKSGILLACLFAAIVGIIFICFHRPLASVFIHFGTIHAEKIYQLAMWILAIRLLGMFFDNVTAIITGSLRGLYDAKYPMWVSIATSWILFIPLAIVLAFICKLGVIGITIAASIMQLVSAVVLIKRWLYQMRRLH